MVSRNTIISGVNIQPWIPRHPTLHGVRVLIVAESHYDENEKLSLAQRENFTREIIGDWGAAAPKNAKRFFRRIAEAFLGKIETTKSKEYGDFWEGVHFYNYVQRILRGHPKDNDRVSDEDIRDSDGAFARVLNALKPDVVLIMSRRIWHAMADENGTKVLSDDSMLGDIYEYRYERGSCLVASTYHPSARISDADWQRRYPPKIKKLLAFVKKRVN